MARPELGSKYLIVFCKSCNKGFRVLDRAIERQDAAPAPRRSVEKVEID